MTISCVDVLTITQIEIDNKTDYGIKAAYLCHPSFEIYEKVEANIGTEDRFINCFGTAIYAAQFNINSKTLSEATNIVSKYLAEDEESLFVPDICLNSPRICTESILYISYTSGTTQATQANQNAETMPPVCPYSRSPDGNTPILSLQKKCQERISGIDPNALIHVIPQQKKIMPADPDSSSAPSEPAAPPEPESSSEPATPSEPESSSEPEQKITTIYFPLERNRVNRFTINTLPAINSQS